MGGDVKMGLGPNLTLDATINPDFGQVEADPAEVNLTAFETRFSGEAAVLPRGRRSCSRINHPNFYYSRQDRRTADRAGERRLRGLPDRQHDSRRRQADRPPAVEDVGRPAVRL